MPESSSDFIARLQRLVDEYDGGSTLAASKRIGIPNATLDKILKGGSKNPRSDTLRRIAQAYGVAVDFLLTGPTVAPTVQIASGEESWQMEAIAQALRLWAAAVYELRLPDRHLENAMQALPLTFDDFCDLLHMGGDDIPNERAKSDIARARSEVIHRFRDALRIAIDLHGVESVRDAIMARGDAIRLRLSHYIEPLANEGVLTPARLENAAKVTPFWPIFAVGGSMSVNLGAKGPLGIPDDLFAAHAAHQGSFRVQSAGSPPAQPKRSRGASKKKHRRGAK